MPFGNGKGSLGQGPGRGRGRCVCTDAGRVQGWGPGWGRRNRFGGRQASGVRQEERPAVLKEEGLAETGRGSTRQLPAGPADRKEAVK
jgi:hypothetical protein